MIPLVCWPRPFQTVCLPLTNRHGQVNVLSIMPVTAVQSPEAILRVFLDTRIWRKHKLPTQIFNMSVYSLRHPAVGPVNRDVLA